MTFILYLGPGLLIIQAVIKGDKGGEPIALVMYIRGSGRGFALACIVRTKLYKEMLSWLMVNDITS